MLSMSPGGVANSDKMEDTEHHFLPLTLRYGRLVQKERLLLIQMSLINPQLAKLLEDPHPLAGAPHGPIPIGWGSLMIHTHWPGLLMEPFPLAGAPWRSITNCLGYLMIHSRWRRLFGNPSPFAGVPWQSTLVGPDSASSRIFWQVPAGMWTADIRRLPLCHTLKEKKKNRNPLEVSIIEEHLVKSELHREI